MIVIGCMLAYCCVFMFGAEAFVESLDTHTVICKVCNLLDMFSQNARPALFCVLPWGEGGRGEGHSFIWPKRETGTCP